jgi:hypothetical protein
MIFHQKLVTLQRGSTLREKSCRERRNNKNTAFGVIFNLNTVTNL